MTTSLTSLLRDHTADPQPDRMPRIAAVVEREGRAGEFLDALRDCTRWKAAPSTTQDIAAAVVGSRLGAGFEWVGMEWFHCSDHSCDRCHAARRGIVRARECFCGPRHRIARFHHRATGAVMHLVPGGRVVTPYRSGDGHGTGLAHQVLPFLVGQTPVTDAHINGVDHHLPAVNMSHSEATEWLRNNGLSLPSPAEWHHATYAGATTRWPWGDEWGDEGDRLVWNAGNSGWDPPTVYEHMMNAEPGPVPPSTPRLRPVTDHLDARAWNAFGLVDCIGNVDEWLADGRVVGGNYHDGFAGFDDAVTPEPHELGSIGFRAFASVPGLG